MSRFVLAAECPLLLFDSKRFVGDTYRWTDGCQTDGRTDKWMDGRTNRRRSDDDRRSCAAVRFSKHRPRNMFEKIDTYQITPVENLLKTNTMLFFQISFWCFFHGLPKELFPINVSICNCFSQRLFPNVFSHWVFQGILPIAYQRCPLICFITVAYFLEPSSLLVKKSCHPPKIQGCL